MTIPMGAVNLNLLSPNEFVRVSELTDGDILLIALQEVRKATPPASRAQPEVRAVAFVLAEKIALRRFVGKDNDGGLAMLGPFSLSEKESLRMYEAKTGQPVLVLPLGAALSREGVFNECH